MNELNHIAFIMVAMKVGKKAKQRRNYGHLKGVETVKHVVKSSIKFKVPIITFYVFSENWKNENFIFIQNYKKLFY